VLTQVACKTRIPLLNHMVRTVREHRLFESGDHLLVAVSGGPDSMALLSLLVKLAPVWSLRLTAIHFNYRLRGSESDGDEGFVEAYCRDRDIPLITRRPTLTKRRRVSSLQALAREARYEAMKSVALEIGADRIAIGHTANDQAETIVMWMLRGAGLTGLAGMPFVRESLFVRPLLRATRDEIGAYLKHEGVPYRQDSSNDTGSYRRNRIRRELIPVMTQIAPAAIRVLQRQAELLRDDECYFEQVTGELFSAMVRRDSQGGYIVQLGAFAALSVALQRRLLRAILRKMDREGRPSGMRIVEPVRQLCLSKGKRRSLAFRHAIVVRERDTFRISQCEEGRKEEVLSAGHLDVGEVPLPIPSSVYWPRTNQHIHVQILPRVAVEPFVQDRSSVRAVFDADRFSMPLLLRSWHPGDRIYPRGMKGKSQKLQDLFTNWKIARHDRQGIPLLAAPEGILWVIGRRQDERFLVRKETVRCLLVTIGDAMVREGVR